MDGECEDIVSFNGYGSIFIVSPSSLLAIVPTFNSKSSRAVLAGVVAGVATDVNIGAVSWLLSNASPILYFNCHSSHNSSIKIGR